MRVLLVSLSVAQPQHQKKVRRTPHRFLSMQRGVTAIEYALIAALICIVIAVSVGTVGTTVRALYDRSEAQIVSAITEVLARL